MPQSPGFGTVCFGRKLADPSVRRVPLSESGRVGVSPVGRAPTSFSRRARAGGLAKAPDGHALVTTEPVGRRGAYQSPREYRIRGGASRIAVIKAIQDGDSVQSAGGINITLDAQLVVEVKSIAPGAGIRRAQPGSGHYLGGKGVAAPGVRRYWAVFRRARAAVSRAPDQALSWPQPSGPVGVPGHQRHRRHRTRRRHARLVRVHPWSFFFGAPVQRPAGDPTSPPPSSRSSRRPGGTEGYRSWSRPGKLLGQCYVRGVFPRGGGLWLALRDWVVSSGSCVDEEERWGYSLEDDQGLD
jgi:hypothetical protein